MAELSIKHYPLKIRFSVVINVCRKQMGKDAYGRSLRVSYDLASKPSYTETSDSNVTQ